MRAVSISGTCGRFLRSYMRLYMLTYMLRIFVSKSEGVGCDVVVLWIYFLWCFSGFLLAFLSSLKWYDNLYGCLSFYNRAKKIGDGLFIAQGTFYMVARRMDTHIFTSVVAGTGGVVRLHYALQRAPCMVSSIGLPPETLQRALCVTPSLPIISERWCRCTRPNSEYAP